jgi:predicted nucleotidyltransferase
LNQQLDDGGGVSTKMSEEMPLRETLGTLGDAHFAVIYGSAAAGRLQARSDLDIAVDFGRKLAFSELVELNARLEMTTGRRVDLVDLHAADPILKMQVVRYGRPIVVNDVGSYHRFQMNAIGHYLDFKITRRPVERAMAHGESS